MALQHLYGKPVYDDLAFNLLFPFWNFQNVFEKIKYEGKKFRKSLYIISSDIRFSKSDLKKYMIICELFMDYLWTIYGLFAMVH